MLQVSEGEVQNSASKEIEYKQEPKIHSNKATTESMQIPEVKVESEAVAPINQTLTNSTSIVEANGIDNEDSINLTIGEDEENLLAEEVRSLIRYISFKPSGMNEGY